ncbi:hypothetical protein AB7360_13180 [Providencia alcalifaciens]|uniref:SpaN/EivJ family type III secretion system needle length determinant n=1 Tax=Providencia alcalifaciens TaxID=126385 RepID=UPI0032DB032C
MSAIKSLSSEKVINNTTELVGAIVKPTHGYNQQGKENANALSFQRLAKKVANVFAQKTLLKPKTQSDFASNTLCLGGQYTASMGIAELVVSMPLRYLPQNTDHMMLETEPQNVLQVEALIVEHFTPQLEIDGTWLLNGESNPLLLEGNEEDSTLILGDVQDDLEDYTLLDDDIPLINMSGMPILHTHNSDAVLKPNSLLRSSGAMEGEATEQPVLNLFNNENDVKASVANKGQQHVFSTLLSPEKPFISEVITAEKMMGSPESIQTSSEGQSSNEHGVAALETMLEGHQPSVDEHAGISTERFMQILTKSEKNQSVLQENTNNDGANIARNSPMPVEVAMVPQAQVAVGTPASELSSTAQKVEQWIEHSNAIKNAQVNESSPRTLTYTFQQWKNAPSVTFELATKTDVIASTYSREVQHVLQDNKHLLSSEKNIYFRQEQERGQHDQQQKQRQQEQHQQEED